MADGTSDVVAHFRAGWEALRRFPILVAPTLVMQVVVWAMVLLFLGGVAGMAVIGGLAAGPAAGAATGFLGLLAGGFVFILVNGILNLLAAGVSVVMAKDALAGREPSLGDALGVVIARLADAAVASLLTMVIVGIGFLLLVVPGVVAAVLLVFTLPAVLLDGQGAVDALRRSVTLVRANLGPVVGLLGGGLVVGLGVTLASRILGFIPLLGALAGAALQGVLIGYLTVVGVRVYQSLPRR